MENLAPVNRCSSLSPSSTPLKLCLFNARLVVNKTLQLKDCIVDECVNLLCIIYAQKDTLSITVPIPLVLVVFVSIMTYYMSSITIVVWFCYYSINHNYNKILKSDWLSTALISTFIGQLNRTVRVMPE